MVVFILDVLKGIIRVFDSCKFIDGLINYLERFLVYFLKKVIEFLDIFFKNENKKINYCIFSLFIFYVFIV